MTFFIRDLTQPEFHKEITKTKLLFEALPDAQPAYKPHERSMALGRLAGHITDILHIMEMTLTETELDMAVSWQSYTMTDKVALLARFQELSSQAASVLDRTADETFLQSWVIRRGSVVLFSGSRYEYFRNQGINQIIHHRAQLGTYIRALGLPLPGMYGQSADGI